MKINQKLLDAAIKLIEVRYPEGNWKGAAAVYTESGKIITSTSPLMPLAATDVCHETGAICEAHKLNESIVACVCLSRVNGKFHILAPCGICQERLYLWGPDVEVAVPLVTNTTKYEVKKLSEVHPYYWKNGFKEDVLI